ncbi:MAG: hypothetical protein LBQ18_03380 [Campylobacteraceae bacterium]|jgi:hypothetical protein|nr:hypothetical protein [Campylobacteraceae bacterium]
MEHISFIISHISRQPSLKKLEQIASYKKLLSLLPPRYQGAVKFMYNKNNTLFFVLRHPGFKMEFNYKTTLIKGLLKQLIMQDESCKCIDADELKFFVSNKTAQKAVQEIKPQNLYKERAQGDFTNRASNEKLRLLFEEIREIVKNNER